MSAHHDDHAHHKPHASFIDLIARAPADVREVTGLSRPAGSHTSKLTAVVPGLYLAKFDDIKDPGVFAALKLPVGLVVNAGVANDQCPTKTGYYGADVLVLPVNLLDDVGDAKAHFRLVNANIDAALAEGKAVVVHCFGSVSRATALVIAYLMQVRLWPAWKPRRPPSSRRANPLSIAYLMQVRVSIKFAPRPPRPLTRAHTGAAPEHGGGHHRREEGAPSTSIPLSSHTHVPSQSLPHRPFLAGLGPHLALRRLREATTGL